MDNSPHTARQNLYAQFCIAEEVGGGVEYSEVDKQLPSLQVDPVPFTQLLQPSARCPRGDVDGQVVQKDRIWGQVRARVWRLGIQRRVRALGGGWGGAGQCFESVCRKGSERGRSHTLLSPRTSSEAKKESSHGDVAHTRATPCPTPVMTVSHPHVPPKGLLA